MSTFPEFTGTLSFSVTGPGVSIDPATGAISIAADRLQEGIEVAITAAEADGTATGRFRLTFQAIAAPPRLMAAPVVAGPAVIGSPADVDPGSWEDASSLALQWCRDGAEIAGATAESYVPVAEDDCTQLTCRVTASNAAGSATAETAAVEVIHVAPSVTGTLGDVELELDSGPRVVEAAAAFAGEALVYAVDGAGATIDPATGKVSIPTGTLLTAAAVSVTASNSGGSATTGFKVTVRGVAPAVTTAPKLEGTGKIGTAVNVVSGSWSGKPAPTLALQWRRGGTDIAGATAASYVPVAADDRTQLTCRVTASNVAGSATAETAAVAVTRVAPSVTGTLGDLELELDSGPRVVEAAPAFTGTGLSYAVTGAGATIDPATGKVSIPTGTLLTAAAVSVTASNSGGSATAGFKVTVRGVAPAVTTAPTISGTPTSGQTLTASDGTWTGRPTPTLSRNWQRNGSNISGATGTTYVLQAADVGAQISVRVTGTNSAGSSNASSSSVTVDPAAQGPANTSVPTISGTGTIGQTLTATSDGTWTGTPTPTLSRNWQRAGADISGATATTYVLQAADGGTQVRLRVTGTNSAGTASAFSTATSVAAATVPVNTVAPAVSGTAIEGEMLTGTTGTWTGNPAPTFARQWQRNGANISGATASTYALIAADVGAQVRHRVIGTNTAGSATAFSPAVLIGAASGDWAIVTVNPSNYLSRLAQARTKKTRYMLDPGVYPDFYWPTNVTDFPIQVIPANRNNPPTIRAIGFGKRSAGKGRNFSHLQDAAAGSNFQNVKLDGLNFIAQRFTQAGNVSLILPDGEGLGWRIQGTSHPSADLVGAKESGSYLGVDINSGSNFEICNCLFDGYAVQLGISTNDVYVHHNQFRNLPEDGVKFSGDRVRIAWNEWFHMRGPTAPMSEYSGGPNPPHPDAIQQMAPADDVTFENNVVIDEHLMHGGLFRNAAASGESRRVIIRGNEIRVKSFTGLGIDNITRDGGSGINGTNIDLLITGNKCWSGAVPGTDGGPMFGHWEDTSWTNSRLNVTNNVITKNWLGSGAGISNNTQSNSGSVWPSGWVEKARDRVDPEDNFAGRYGATAGVVTG